MHTGSAAHLRHAADALLHLFGGDHHQIGQLVDHNDHPGQGLLPAGLAVFIVVFQVAHAHLGKQAVTLEHLHHGPLQGSRGLLRVGHHGDIEMGYAVIYAQLHHLGVDHDELYLIGSGLVEQAQDQGVHAHGLARAGGTGNEHMGQLCDVAHDALAADILAQSKAELGFCVDKLGRLKNIPQIHGADDFVGHLDAHGGDLVRDGGDAHVDHAQSQGQVPRKVCDPGELHALVQLDIVAGHGGATDHAHNGGADAEAAYGPFQPLFIEHNFVFTVHR